MPVVINELVIRANVVEQGEGGKAAPAAPSGGGGGIDKTEIIQECVDIILEVLNNKKER